MGVWSWASLDIASLQIMEENLKNNDVSKPNLATLQGPLPEESGEQVMEMPEAAQEDPSDTKKNGEFVVQTRSVVPGVEADSGDNLDGFTGRDGARAETDEDEDRFFMSTEEEGLLNGYIAQMIRGERPDFSQLSSDQLQKFIAYVDLLKAAVNRRMRGKYLCFRGEEGIDTPFFRNHWGSGGSGLRR